MKILYLTSSAAYRTNTVLDYDQAFAKYSAHDIYYYDLLAHEELPNFSDFDALAFSYTFFHFAQRFSRSFINKVSQYQGLKIAIFQDEYLYYLRHRKHLPEWNLSGILTVMPQESQDAVFGPELRSVPRLQVLTGYVPEHLRKLFDQRLPMRKRRWHVGYRTRTYSPIFGRLCREKMEIGVDMRRFCRERNVPANIEVSEEKRLHGPAWTEFLRDCRVVLATESGCNVFDFDGRIARKIRDYEEKHPDAGFWEIHANCIGDADGAIRTNQISPRIFEAAALGTPHICYEGEYSGLLLPWRHYIPLRKDYSNLEEVFTALADETLLERLAQNAYADLIAGEACSYRSFIRKFDAFIDGLPRNLSEVESSPDFPTSPPLPLNQIQCANRQKKADEKAAQLGRKYSGKKVLAYGAGAAWRHYAHFFQNVEIMAFLLDDKFLNRPPEGLPAPCASFEKFEGKSAEIDGVLVFCRLEFAFSMGQAAASLCPAGQEAEICVLYDQPCAGA